MTAPAVCPAIVGIGSSAIERRSKKSITALAVDAALAALADSGLSKDDIDGYVGAPLATNAGALHVDGADEISVRHMTRALGLTNLSYGVDLAKAFPTDMVVAAAHALQSKMCDAVLGVRALYNLTGVNYATKETEHAYGDDQFLTPFGYFAAGARFATRARRYLEASGADRRDLFAVVAHARRNAKNNPLAIWRDRDVTLEEYLDAPMVATPLCRLDCDMPVCGAGAFVMMRADRARTGPNRPVYLAGATAWQRPEEIFVRSRRSREDIDFCQLYDGFSTMLYEWLEGLGWCEPNTAWKFVRDGHCERDGRLPVNTFGGSLGEGRLHGMGHLREAVLQLSGRAKGRQLAKADNGLVQVGPFDQSSFVVLSVSPQ
jgi:acetyl-CoA acetyltransferase